MLGIDKSENKVFWLLILLIMISTGFLSCSLVSASTLRWPNYLLVAYILYYVISHRNYIDSSQTNFRWMVIAFMLFPLLSSISCFVLEHQSPFATLKSVFPMMTFGVYFYLHAKQVSEKTAMKVIFVIALLIAVIQIVQQFSPTSAIFGIANGESIDEIAATMERTMRNGLYRFTMHYNGAFTLPILYYFWSRVRNRMSGRNVFYFVLMLVSIYLMLTRQVMVVTLAGIVISLMLLKDKTKASTTIFAVILLTGLLLFNFESLFQSLLDTTTAQVNDKDYVRYASMQYFFEQSIVSPIAALLGHGMPSAGSTYESHIQDLQSIHFYASDVGAVGAAYKFGWVYVIVFYIMVLKIWLKFRKLIPSYLTLFIVSTFLFSIMMFLISKDYYLTPYAIILYIIDLHVAESPLCADQKEML